MGRDERIREAVGKFYKKNDPQTKRSKKAKKPRDPADPPLEREEQATLARALRRAGGFWIHVPNEGRRSKIQGYRLKMAGMVSGCPDVLVFSRPPVAIELKRQKGGRVSDAQLDFMKKLSREGWRCFVAYGAQAAFRALREAGHEIGELDGKETKHRFKEIVYLDEETET